MGITFNLYRNADGSLDGRYKLGDKPVLNSGGTPALAWSAPSGLADGNTLTITTDGTNPFGSGPTNVRFDDFSGGTLDAEATESNTMFDITSQFYPSLFTNDSRSGALAIRGFNSATGNPSINTVTLTSAREVFLSYATKIPSGSYFPGATSNNIPSDFYATDSSWKISWLQDGDGTTNDICVPTHVNNGSWYVAGNGLNNKLTTGEMGGNKPTWFGFNNWTRIASFLKAGATPEVDVGKVYFQAATQGQTLFEVEKDVIVFEGGNASPPYHWNKWNLTGWCRTGLGGSDGLGADIMFLFDDVYIAWGDNAAARAELGDAATYSACTDLAICKPTSWANGQIDLSIQSGAFSLSESLWLHITLADNTTRYTVQVN